jgi:hypothetical protein
MQNEPLKRQVGSAIDLNDNLDLIGYIPALE